MTRRSVSEPSSERDVLEVLPVRLIGGVVEAAHAPQDLAGLGVEVDRVRRGHGAVVDHVDLVHRARRPAGHRQRREAHLLLGGERRGVEDGRSPPRGRRRSRRRSATSRPTLGGGRVPGVARAEPRLRRRGAELGLSDGGDRGDAAVVDADDDHAVRRPPAGRRTAGRRAPRGRRCRRAGVVDELEPLDLGGREAEPARRFGAGTRAPRRRRRRGGRWQASRRPAEEVRGAAAVPGASAPPATVALRRRLHGQRTSSGWPRVSSLVDQADRARGAGSSAASTQAARAHRQARLATPRLRRPSSRPFSPTPYPDREPSASR